MRLSEREKMLAGALYDPSDPELAEERGRARELLHRLNLSPPEQAATRQSLLRELIPSQGEKLTIEPPFFCDYGTNITLGDRVFFNFNCVLLDPGPIRIGNGVLFGPAVQVYTATHPTDHRIRQQGLESALPIEIGNDAWIGGGAIILPGVSIGDRTIIGAGSVVTRSIPAGVLAAGNPCRVLRSLA